MAKRSLYLSTGPSINFSYFKEYMGKIGVEMNGWGGGGGGGGGVWNDTLKPQAYQGRTGMMHL